MRNRSIIASLAALLPLLACRCAGDSNGPAEENAPPVERIYCAVHVNDNQNPALRTIAFLIETDGAAAETDSFVYLEQDLIPQHPLPETASAVESLFVSRDSVFFRIPPGEGHGMASPGWRFSSPRIGESIAGAALSCEGGAGDSLWWAGVVCPCDGECGATADSALTHSHPPLVRRIYRPTYPRQALQAGIEGRVVSRVFIDRCGDIIRAEIIDSSDPVFERPVLASLQLAAFHPARAGTLFVKSRVAIPFEFSISDAKGRVEAREAAP